MSQREIITTFFKSLQSSICQAIEETDKKSTFHADAWERPGGGGGISRVITDGNIIEKGGVNFSAVEGVTPAGIMKTLSLPESEEATFFATGVSIVMHPVNPMVPIIHMNVRYFEMSNGTWWFGGGIDLTPHYIDKEDAHYFHQQLKTVCDRFDINYYPEFKKWADDYFFIKHRNETRGVGGIFFDHLNEKRNKSKEELWEFVKAVGESFAPIYTHFMKKKSKLPYTEKEKQWQLLRRGRYVEFNLVWDRGTKFGLETDGRTESILMSLPPQANWEYNFIPDKGSAEERTLNQLIKGIDWLH